MEDSQGKYLWIILMGFTFHILHMQKICWSKKGRKQYLEISGFPVIKNDQNIQTFIALNMYK